MTTATLERTEQATKRLAVISKHGWVVASALEQCATFAAQKSDGRPCLNGVLVRSHPSDRSVYGAYASFVATDGFRLLEVRTTVEVEPFEGRIYSLESVRAALKSWKGLKQGERNSAWVDFDLGHEPQIAWMPEARYYDNPSPACVITPMVELQATYPRYENLMPARITEPDAKRSQWAVNGSLLAEMAATAAKHGDSGLVRMYPAATPSQPFVATWGHSGHFEATAVIMPMFVSW